MWVRPTERVTAVRYVGVLSVSLCTSDRWCALSVHVIGRFSKRRSAFVPSGIVGIHSFGPPSIATHPSLPPASNLSLYGVGLNTFPYMDALMFTLAVWTPMCNPISEPSAVLITAPSFTSSFRGLKRPASPPQPFLNFLKQPELRRKAAIEGCGLIESTG